MDVITGDDRTARHDRTAGGAFTCDFAVDGSLPVPQLVADIDRDRQALAGEPGMRHKHIPARLDGADYLSGGRYLFDTFEQAGDYCKVLSEFTVDGVRFFDRDYISDPACYAWQVLGADEFADIHTAQVVLRTERWRTPDDGPAVLGRLWPQLRSQARNRGLSAAWLLYQPDHALAALVYFAGRSQPWQPGAAPDFASLAAIEEAAPLGEAISALGWEKIFDRSQWVLNIWFPFEEGDRGDPALWPNSPPLPGPSDS